MLNESGCKKTQYGFAAALTALVFVVWLVVRFTTPRTPVA